MLLLSLPENFLQGEEVLGHLEGGVFSRSLQERALYLQLLSALASQGLSWLGVEGACRGDAANTCRPSTLLLIYVE